MTIAVRRTRRKKTNELRAVSTARATVDPRALLAWYDKHRRILPWRAHQGAIPDPYRVWLSEIMLQQTTVKAVGPYYGRFLELWPTVQALARAELEDVLRAWAGLGYYARARNLHACAREIVQNHRGIFPSDEAGLHDLPGIGAYTAAAIAAIAFDAPAVPIDGNVERVVSRLFALEQQLPAAKPRLHELADSLMPAHHYGDFAQALMDLGATICTPKKPACALCPWNDVCAAFKRGDQETFPRKAPKREGALRQGAAFVVLRADGHLLLQRRPEKGLLGGMSEVPCSEWRAGLNPRQALGSAPRLGENLRWSRRGGVVNHVFTHFPLALTVFVTRVGPETLAPNGSRWAKLDNLAAEALPNVMRKVIAHALEFMGRKGGGGKHGGKQRRLDGKPALSGPLDHRAR